jgi:hypothetical protein
MSCHRYGAALHDLESIAQLALWLEKARERALSRRSNVLSQSTRTDRSNAMEHERAQERSQTTKLLRSVPLIYTILRR